MKVYFNVFLVLISCLVFSCDLWKEKDIHYYHKNFFLGETNFLIEGEATNFSISIITIISSGDAHYSLDTYNEYNKGWEISTSEFIRNDIHHYDYNFTKPGWYKTISWHNKPIDNDPRHSSVSNVYFYEPDNRY